MPHDHAHQGHSHMDPKSGDARVAIAIWANGLLTLAQVIGGLLSGSLALLADALHNLSDMAALVIAFGARKIARRPADAAMSFGYQRIEVVAALINYTTLILIGLYLLFEGLMRLFEPTEVAGWTVVIVGAIALLVDALTAALTYSMQKGSVNIRAMFLHNLTDALASVAVIVGGVMILLYDIYIIDPIITLIIASYIIYLSLKEIKTPIRTLMLAAPEALNAEEIAAAIAEVEGVEALHHLHLWQMEEHAAALEARIIVSTLDWKTAQAHKARIKAMLLARYGIAHSTLELEHTSEQVGRTQLIGH